MRCAEEEYDRINRLLECDEDEYFEYESSGHTVQYAFYDGYFTAVLYFDEYEVTNEGTYKIATDTVELFFNNGTHQSWPYELKDGELYLTNPN